MSKEKDIEIFQQKNRKRINKRKIIDRTKILLRRKCKFHEIDPKKLNIVTGKILEGFNKRQIEFLYYLYPYWFVIQHEAGKKFYYKNISKKRKELIALAKKLSGSEICSQWKVLCDSQDCSDCDIYQADTMSYVTIVSKIKKEYNFEA